MRRILKALGLTVVFIVGALATYVLSIGLLLLFVDIVTAVMLSLAAAIALWVFLNIYSELDVE